MASIFFVDASIAVTKLREIAQQRFGDLVKGVVDIEQKVMALGGELHADEEAFLMKS